MSTAEAQGRWRSRHRFTKKQLNVNARVETHAALDEIAEAHQLRGKAEAVPFSCFITRWMMQQAPQNPDVAALLDRLAGIYHQNREDYQP